MRSIMHGIERGGKVPGMKPHPPAALLLAAALAPARDGAAATAVTPAQIAALVADPKLVELSPEALIAAVRPLARLKDAQKAEYQWTLAARAPRPGLRWIAASYEPDQGAKAPAHGWRLTSLQVGLTPVAGNEAALAAALVESISGRLGPGRREGKRRVWPLAGPLALYLLRGRETDPTSDPPAEVRVVSLEIQSVAH
jgi:hypothetical protein